MNKKSSIFLVSFFLGLAAYSQQTNKVSFEAGAVINKPLVNEERKLSDEGWTFTLDWTYKYYTSAGYFLKFNYEQKLISRNKWTLLFPIGLSFISQVTKFERHGGAWGCFGGESADELKTVNRRSGNLSFGPAVQVEIDKFRISGNFILNNCFTFASKTRSTPNNADDEYYSTHQQFDYNLYLSSQFSVLYKIKRNMWFGPACEVFYGNILYLRSEARAKRFGTYYPDYGPEVNITGKNIWINPGIKLQIDL